MNVASFTTTTESENINDIFDDPQIKHLFDNNKETIENFKSYGIHSGADVTLILDLLSSAALSEVPKHLIPEILKGKSYLSKKVTTEYFVIDSGEDLTDRLNDDYIKYLTSDDPESLPEDKQFTQVGDRVINMEDYYEEKSAALKEEK